MRSQFRHSIPLREPFRTALSGAFDWAAIWITYNPYIVKGSRRFTQLHCHSNVSGYSFTPAQLVAMYLAEGFSALAITDYDVVTAQPAGLIAIRGAENVPTTGHIVGADCDYVRGAETDSQTIIDGIVADGGFAILAHVAWINTVTGDTGFTYTEMYNLNGYTGIEIHNALCIVKSNYKGYAVTLWDLLLKHKSSQIWAFSSDDLHDVTNVRGYNIGRICVFSADATAISVIAAIKAGNFVADVSNYGVTLNQPVINSNKLRLNCPGATSIRFIGPDGLLESDSGDTGEYSMLGTEQYIRAEVIGDYTEGFGADLDWVNRWGVVAGTWSVGGGILSQTNAVVTNYWLTLKRHILGDIEIKCDLLYKNASGQGGIVFNSPGSELGYYLRIKGSEAVKDLTMFELPATELDTATQAIVENVWYSLRIQYINATGNIKARVWERAVAEPETWSIDVNGVTFNDGGFIALRCQGACDFDNLYINGFKSYYQPITLKALPFSYEPEIDTFIEGMVIPPSDEYKIQLNNFILQIKYGLGIDLLTEAFDVLQIYGGEGNEDSLRNLVKRAHDATLTGAPVWAQYEGYTGGAGKHIDTNFNGNDGVNYQLNDSSFFFYSRTNRAASTTAWHGVYDGVANYARVRPQRNLNNPRGHINSATEFSLTTVGLGTLGMHYMGRNAGDVTMGQQKQYFTLANIVTAIPDFNFYMLAGNAAGVAAGWDSLQLALFGAGRYFTTEEMDIITDAFDDFLAANGKEVF